MARDGESYEESRRKTKKEGGKERKRHLGDIEWFYIRKSKGVFRPKAMNAMNTTKLHTKSMLRSDCTRCPQ